MKKLLTLLIVVVGLSSYSQTTIYVTNALDSVSGSLRAAIDSANARPGTDSIILLLAANDTIHLGSSLQDIAGDLVITGQACQNPTIDGDSLYHGFSVSSGTLTLNYLNIFNCHQNGNGSAVIGDSIYLNYCFFYGNTTWEHNGSGPGFGGAIRAVTIWAHNSTFSYNQCTSDLATDGDGGAALAAWTVHLYNCTFTDNYTTFAGSAIALGGDQPIASQAPSIIYNCVFKNNFAKYGAVIFTDSVPVGSLITGNVLWGDSSIAGSQWGPEIVFFSPGGGDGQSGGCNFMPDTSNNNRFAVTSTDVWGVNPQFATLGYYGDCVPTLPILNTSLMHAHNACLGLLVANAGADTTICSGSTVVLGGTPTASGGTPGYTYSWSGGVAPVPNPSISPLITTTYIVTVTDQLGATATDSVTITVNPNPVTDLGADRTACYGSITSFCENPGYIGYSWSGPGIIGSTNQNCIQVNPPIGMDSYSLTITDSNNCSSYDQVLINIISSTLNVDAGPNKIYCSNNASCINIGGFPTASGGIPPYAYQWGPGVIQQIANPCVSPTVSTTYPITVTDAAGCSATDTVFVFVDPFIIVNAGIDTTVCYGSTITLGGNPTASGGTGLLTYSWAPGIGLSYTTSTNPTASPVITTTYCVTVTDSLGCSAAGCQTIIVRPLPTANAGPDQSIYQCSADSIILGGSPTATGTVGPYSYLWTPNFNIAFRGADTLAANPIIDSLSYNINFTVTITDLFGCQASDNVLVTAAPNTVFANAGNNTTICSGTPVTIGGSPTAVGGTPGYTYDWSPAGGLSNPNLSNPLASPTLTTTYLVITTDSRGCQALDSVRVNVGSNSLSTNIIPNNPLFWCDNTGGNVTLTAITSPISSSYSYLWTGSNMNNATGQSTTGNPSIPGTYTYTVIVTDSVGCQATDSIDVVVYPSPVINSLNTTAATCFGGSDGTIGCFASSGCPPYNFTWSDGDQSQTRTNLIAGNYSVTLTNGCGCSVSSSTNVNQPPQLLAQITSTTGGALPDTLCIEALGFSPLNFAWSSPNVLPNGCLEITSSGLYTATVSDANGCIVSVADTSSCPNICVWPGDADHNGLADNNDLLAIGLAYGTIDAARSSQNINWYPHISYDWVDTLSSGTNYKHIDCNGNGTINADDTLAILQNFGLTHAKTDEQRGWRMTDPSLYIALVPDTVKAGDTMYATLTLGDINIPAANVYGLAFTINYDALVVDSTKTKVTFGNSWLGTATDKISIAKDLKANGQLKCALTRIDHTTRSGFGQIGQAAFVITTDNINGKNLAYYKMNVWLSDLIMIDNLGNYITVNEGSDSLQVEFEPTGIADLGLRNADLKIQPNPASEEVMIIVTDELIGGEMKLVDVEGRTLTRKRIQIRNSKFEIRNFASGIYFIQVITEKGMLTKRLVIAR